MHCQCFKISIHFSVDGYVSRCICAKVSLGYTLLCIFTSTAVFQILIVSCQNYKICLTGLLSSDLKSSNLFPYSCHLLLTHLCLLDKGHSFVLLVSPLTSYLHCPYLPTLLLLYLAVLKSSYKSCYFMM